MSGYRDPHDAFRHRNLQQIGRVLTLPPRAGSERQARWQQVVVPADGAAPAVRRSFVGRHRGLALATSSLAAMILLTVWLLIGHGETVTAAAIFQDFKVALAKSLSIRLDGIDLGTAVVSGNIIVERAEFGEANDTRYAEVHVLLKADNPEWNDLDAALVICQTPTESWQYCRGNGGSSGSFLGSVLARLLRQPVERRVVPTEYLVRGRGWRDFARQPLDHFGTMPLSMGFGDGQGSKVNYAFGREERIVVEQFLRLLLDLSNVATADRVIEDLKRSAGEAYVERSEASMYVLHASRFSRIGELELAEPTIPDVSALVSKYVWEINYDPETGRVPSWTATPPAELYDTGVGVMIDLEQLKVPLESPQDLIAHLAERAVDVQVDKISPRQWTIRVTGYPFPTNAAGLEWLGQFVRTLRESLTLAIYYNPQAGGVQRAEFRGIGPADGHITLNIGHVELDPARLKADHWVTPRTMIHEP